MKTIFTTITAVLLCISVNAQVKTKKADRLFDRWDYFRAAKSYQKKSVKHANTDLYFKLGESYRKMNNNKKEEQAAYDEVNKGGTYSNPEFYLNYGQVLRSNGQNADSKIAFDKHTELVPSDSRGQFFSESIDIVAEDHKYDEPITVSNIASLNSEGADFSPTIYKDGIVFTSSRKTKGHGKTYGWTGSNYLDMYYAEQGASEKEFKTPAPFGGKKSNQKFHDGPVCFSADYNTMYFSRVEKFLEGEDKELLNIERNKLFTSTFVDGKWSKPVQFKYNSNDYSVAHPYLTKDGSRLYYTSDMAGGHGETDIYYSNREGESWSAPINAGPNVNTFNREKYPTMDDAGNLYFSSNGYQGFGGMDICVALNENGNLSKAKPLKAPFNSPSDDSGIIFLKSGKTGYITTDRSGSGLGNDDIYYFDLSQDAVDQDLVTSIYTIGYRPKEVVAVVVEETAVDTVVAEPVVVETVVVSTVKAPVDGRVYFDFDKSDLRSDNIPYLDSVVTYMNAFPNMNLVIGGHCDAPGTIEYNIALSNRRNASVMTYLISKGIKKERLIATGYGIDGMVNNCKKGVVCTKEQNQLNRRVEMNFVKK